MVEKKWTNTKKAGNDSFEKKVEEAKDSVSNAAEKVWEKSKKLIWTISAWWDKSSTWEKICMIWWIILLLIGLIILWDIVVWLIFILLWRALISWFFVKKGK